MKLPFVKPFYLFFFLLLFLWACPQGGQKHPSAPEQTKIGSRIGNEAPDFTLTARDGSQVSLSQFRGKVVFLNFWATWCGPCRVEMPAMERLKEKMQDQDFVILAVSSDDAGWEVIDPFVKANKLSFLILLDAKKDITMKYNSYRLPETFIIDPKGKIVDKRVGAASWDNPMYIQYFQKLLESDPKGI